MIKNELKNKKKGIQIRAKKQISPLSSLVDQTPYSEHITELDDFFHYLNEFYQANLGKITMGMSPAVIGSTHWAWLLQLAQSPGHLLALASYPLTHVHEFVTHL